MLYFFGLLFAPFVWLLFRPKIVNRRYMNVRGKAIFVSNHWSLADPIMLAFISPRIIHFMAKKELFESRLGNIAMRMLFAFPVDRGHADLHSMKQAKAVLDQGRVFGIFPEGKRSVTGELDELEKGAAFLALRCDAPIIPIYSDPRTFRRFRVRMIVGEPMNAKEIAATREGKSVDVVTNAIRDRLQGLRYEMEGMR